MSKKKPDIAEAADPKPSAVPSWRKDIPWLAVILLIGALLRAAYLSEIVHAPDFDSPRQDPSVHDYWARAIVTGDWTPPKGECDPLIRETVYFRPPGYPFFLAAVYWLTNLSYFGARIVQMAMGLINCVLLWSLARSMLGRAAGLIAAFMAAVYWVFIYSEGELNEQVLLITLILAEFHFLRRWLRKPSLLRAIPCGLLIGAYALIRPNVMLYAGVIGLWMLWVLWRANASAVGKDLFRRVFLSWAGFSAAVMICVLPVTVRNYVVAKDVVLISSYFGENLLIGNGPDSDGCTPWTPYLQKLEGTGRWSVYVYVNVVRGVERELNKAGIKHSEVSSYFTKQAVDFMLANKWRTVKLIAKKTLLFWGPLEVTCNKVVELEKAHYKTLRFMPGFPVMMALFLMGTLILLQQFRKGNLGLSSESRYLLFAAYAFIAVYFLSYLPFFSTGRYRVPLIPFMILGGAWGIWQLWTLFRAQDTRRSGILYAVAFVVFWGVCSVNATGYVPDRARWYFERALAHEARERWEPAIGEIRKYLEIKPENAELRNALGLMYSRLGRRDEAIREFRETLKFEPEYALCHNNLGYELAKLGRNEEARAEYLEALRIDPNLVLAHNNFGNLLVSEGNFDEAQRHFEQAARLAPDDIYVHYNWANMLVKKGDYVAAVDEYARAVEKDPRNAYIYNDYAIALAGLGRFDESIARYQEALKLSPDYVDAHINMGAILEKVNRFDEARTHYEEACRLAPDYQRAKDKLEALRRRISSGK